MDDTKKREQRKIFIKQLFLSTRKENIHSLRAEDMASYMGISKVTMYKYFDSKKDILNEMVGFISDYFKEKSEFIFTEKDDSAIGQYQQSFEQSLMLNFYLSEGFFEGFRKDHPELYETLLDSGDYRFHYLDELYKRGEKEGIFYPVNSAIFILEDELILKKLLTSEFLIQHGLRFEQALLDYYQMQKRKLIRPEFLNDVDDLRTEKVIQHFVKKNGRRL